MSFSVRKRAFFSILGIFIYICASGAVLSRAASSDEAEVLYQRARQRYHKLIQSGEKSRVHWLDVIGSFQEIVDRFPKHRRAVDAQYTIGLLYRNLAAKSADPRDQDRAIDAFNKVALGYPKHHLADDALYHIAEIYRAWKKDPIAAYFAYRRVYELHPNGDMAPKARVRAAELAGENEGKPKDTGGRGALATLEKIRFWSKPNYTRVVVYLDRPAKYGKPYLLRRDPKHNRPARLYFDIEKSTLGREVKKPIKIGDGLLKRVRAGQFSPTVTRVVMDIESIDDYQIVSWHEPFRIIVDVHGKNGIKRRPAPKTPQIRNEIDKEVEKLLAREEMRFRRIVVDPGHGGSDPGAIGPHGVKEKDVVLDIARRLASYLKKMGFEVFMTRREDIFLSLEERTAIANEKQADLFVSIHANASPNRKARGIATYVFNNSDDEESMRVAALENQTSFGAELDSSSYLQMTLASLRKDQQTNLSRKLAAMVQKEIMRRLGRRYRGTKNLGVREAYFYVLLGAQMPCILVETSFISNPVEERWLKRAPFRDRIALGIARGIKKFTDQRRKRSRRVGRIHKTHRTRRHRSAAGRG